MLLVYVEKTLIGKYLNGFLKEHVCDTTAFNLISNPTRDIQHYVIKFVSDVLRFPPPIKLTATI